MACSTKVVRYVWKNGRSSGGSRSTARSAMNLWPLKPQAPTRAVGTNEHASATSATGSTFRTFSMLERIS